MPQGRSSRARGMIFLFTDYGNDDPYVGQLKAAVWGRSAGALLVDLLHRAPNFDVRAGAHLLAAFATRFGAGSVCIAVVDPGVGSKRHGVVLRADGVWYVGPDNGLLATVAARADSLDLWRIVGCPEEMSASFHGRDLFAPLAARLDAGEFPQAELARIEGLEVGGDGASLAEVIYLDHYGNAMTGLRAGEVADEAIISVRGARLTYARVFASVRPGQCFWYRNSIGLVEIAANRASAAQLLGLAVGEAVGVDG